MPKKTTPKSALPSSTRVRLPKVFRDARGDIIPLVDDTVMRSALLITSKKGAVRANHYHKTDWHFCYVLSGEIEYFERPVGSKRKPKRMTFKQGDMFFTPPMVEHTMLFPKDTAFLTLSRNPRNPAAYEKDLVRVELVKP